MSDLTPLVDPIPLHESHLHQLVFLSSQVNSKHITHVSLNDFHHVEDNLGVSKTYKTVNNMIINLEPIQNWIQFIMEPNPLAELVPVVEPIPVVESISKSE